MTPGATSIECHQKGTSPISSRACAAAAGSADAGRENKRAEPARARLRQLDQVCAISVDPLLGSENAEFVSQAAVEARQLRWIIAELANSMRPELHLQSR